MHEIAYAIRGFLTVRKDSLRIPLNGSLAVRADLDSGLFSGDLVLDQSSVSRRILGASLFSAAVQITADSPVIGRIDHEGRMYATVTVTRSSPLSTLLGRMLIGGGSCRTAAHAIVPLRSKPGFDLERGGRLAGRYHRPPFTGCGWITPLVNLVVARPGERRRHRSHPAHVLRHRPKHGQGTGSSRRSDGRDDPPFGEGAGPDQPGIGELSRQAFRITE